MTLPSSGAISLSQVNTELGFGSTTQISLNDTSVRNLFGVSSGQISMSDGYGKQNVFTFSISSNQTDANLRTLAVNAGWNQNSKVIATINSGVRCSANSTSAVGLTINGSFPNGVTLINNGVIVGCGGNGGNGHRQYPSALSATAGGGGGKALAVSVACTIQNSGTIAGGGGGGGGSYSGYSGSYGGGGGGGGGGRSSLTNSGAGVTYPQNGTGDVQPNTNATGGTYSSAGVGGDVASYNKNTSSYEWNKRKGGNGGNWGAAGGTGGTDGGLGAGASGGSGGACLTGNGFITWTATGSRYGSIS